MVECTNCSCEDIKKIVKEIVTEVFQQRMAEVKTKKKRAPSKYNLFVGTCMKQPGENMKTCAAKYKAQKKTA